MITAIDLGSNSYRVVCLDCNTLEIKGEYEETVGTADGLATTGKISDETLNRIINAIHASQKKLQFNPKQTICKTTAAMRKATNSAEIILQIQKQTGCCFEIISGDEEARLTLLAIKNALKRERIATDNFLVLDIGGGSTELTLCQCQTTISQSFDFGIVTLTQCSENIQDFLDTKQDFIKAFLLGYDISNSLFVSTAGTPTTIAAIKQGLNYYNYDRNKINGTTITPSDIENFTSKLQTLSLNEISLLVGSRRTPFMYAGATILKLFFEILNKTEAVVFDDGLREGIAIDWCLRRL